MITLKKWGKLFGVREKHRYPVIATKYRLFQRGDISFASRSGLITLSEYAHQIFLNEEPLQFIAFGEQYGTLTIITFGYPLREPTKNRLEEMRPCGCIIKYELN